MAEKIIRIATRQSPLALWQAEHVAERLEQAFPGVRTELVKMVTRGDKILDAPLAKVGGKGLFVKELEQGMLEGSADIAVHSMKDVPVDFPEGLHLAAILSIWPETYCYTFDEALSCGIPVLSTPLGAPAERLKQYNCGWLAEPLTAEAMQDAREELALAAPRDTGTRGQAALAAWKASSDLVGVPFLLSAEDRLVEHGECDREGGRLSTRRRNLVHPGPGLRRVHRRLAQGDLQRRASAPGRRGYG